MTTAREGAAAADPAPRGRNRPAGILATSFWVALLFLATRALGFIREPLVAALYGASAPADSFYVALGIVNLVYAVALGGLVPSVIPVFVGKRGREGDGAAWGFLGGFAVWLSAGFLVVAAVMFLAADGVVSLFGPGLPPETHAMTVRMLRVLLLLPLFTALTTTLSHALNCHDRFVLPAAGPLLGNVVSLALILALTAPFGVRAVAIGVIVGGAAQALLLVWAALGVARGYAPRVAFRDRDLGTALRLALPGVGSEALLSVMPFVIVFFGTALPAGAYSSIQYGNKVQVLFLDALVAAVSVVMYPRLARAAQGGGDRSGLRDLSAVNVRLMVTLLLPVTAAVVVLRYPLIELVYQRRAFDPEATRRTAAALGLLALSLVPLGVKDAVVRTFYALHDVVTPLRAIAVAVALDVLLSAVLVGPFGAAGLLAAFSASSAVLGAELLWLLRRRGLRVVDRALARELFKALAATAVMAAVLGLAVRALPGLGAGAGHTRVLVLAWDLALAVGASCLAYGGALLALRHPEAVDGARAVRSRLAAVWKGIR